MTFLAPGWLAVAALASLAVAAIHLIAWRLPRTVALPTARFVPDEPARRAARTVRPADLPLLALRIVILLLAGAALARPAFPSRPSGAATVIAIERSRTIVASALVDSVSRVPRGDHTTFVVFDTTAHVFLDESSALSATSNETGPLEGSLSVGLVGAFREARRLSASYDTVRVVVVSAFARGSFDNATRRIRETWGDTIHLVRVPRLPDIESPSRVAMFDSVDDPIAAAIRLAESNRMIRGASVVRRTGSPARADPPDSGQVEIFWSRAEPGDSERVDGIHAGGYTSIGHFISTRMRDSGHVVARWINGEPAAWEIPRGGGCARTIGFDVPDVGDFVLSPSFQRVVSVLLAPCAGTSRTEPASDSLIAALASPLGPRTLTIAGTGTQNRFAALLMLLAILLTLYELWARRHGKVSLVEPTRS